MRNGGVGRTCDRDQDQVSARAFAATTARTAPLTLTGAETTTGPSRSASTLLVARSRAGEAPTATRRPVGWLALALTGTAHPPALVALIVALEIRATSVRLADGEVGGLPRFLMAFDARQGSAYQWPMNWAVLDRGVSHLVFGLTQTLQLLLFELLVLLNVFVVRRSAIAWHLN
jgi:hypothetical protein